MSNNDSSSNAKANAKAPITYSQIKILGIGSFGKAYLVECNNDKTLAVIKTMIIENMTEEEQREALLEAKILEKLDHPNIIKFREVFMARKPVFTLNIVMDYADGGDLQSRIKEQKGKYFSETQIMDWFTQICLAIKHIHDKKILHRDLKSQNIFLTKNGLIKLGDFGIAKCLNFTLEKARTVVGTPFYLSPEIVENKPYSFKSDIWSLGVLLYEIVCLKMPFDASSLPMLYCKIIRGAYTPVPNCFTKDLRTLLNSLLTVDSEKRPGINDILRMPYVRNRIRNFLSEMEYNNEFSNDILKKHNKIPTSKNSNGGSSSANNETGFENKPKSTSSNAFPKKAEHKSYNQLNQKSNSNSDNHLKDKIEDSNNRQSNSHISQTPNSKPDNKYNKISNEGSNVRKKDVDRKDIKDIGDFLRNKKNEMKKNSQEIMHSQSNLSNKSNQSKESQTTNFSVNTYSNGDNINNSNSKKLNNSKNTNLSENWNLEDKTAIKQEKNERKTDLKDFMKKKKREKSSVNGQEGIIWMKGMEDILNLNIDSSNNPVKETNYSINSSKQTNSNKVTSSNYDLIVIDKEPKHIKNHSNYDNNNYNFNNITDSNNYNNNRNYCDDSKDKEDYLNVHKMYIDLDNIQKEDEEEDIEENEMNPDDFDVDDVHTLTRDFSLLSEEDIQNMNNNMNLLDLNKDHHKSEENIESDNCLIEGLRIELETALGFKLFKKVYNIIQDNTNPYQFIYDTNYLKSIIKRDLASEFSNYEIEKALGRIPEVYSIILKEREMMYC